MEKVKAVKPELEFTDYSNFEAEDIPQVKGLSQRIIAQIPGSSVATRILQFEPDTNTSPMGVQLHDFWEELYIIEGSIIDLELNEEFKEGAVACRPPGMKHGPWKTSEGCKIFEVRYYTKGQ
ncbi:cupin domain-containing protein [Neobacillus sp. SuZ13]|uniref:cupin domain-containing protein n=1 Tax=Neobacillus sp. SuZ13 TaxID=3047875 RepID=UPI0024BF43E4|nr:cupin domain-containing protein [Neobacillus sp. SuZ13]WHY67706.1 cupin domain-containing protein [Neobacillus sp. SuZ13]